MCDYCENYKQVETDDFKINIEYNGINYWISIYDEISEEKIQIMCNYCHRCGRKLV